MVLASAFVYVEGEFFFISEGQFCQTWHFCWQFPFLKRLTISFHASLACKIFTYKFFDIIVEAPLYVMNCFSLVTFKILDFCKLDSNVSWCGLPWAYPGWYPLGFFTHSVHSLLHIWDVLSSQCFCCLLSPSLLKLPQRRH